MALDAERELTQWTAGIDVNLPLQIATLDASIGRRPGLQGSPREGPESAPKPPFHCEREVGFIVPKLTFRIIDRRLKRRSCEVVRPISTMESRCDRSAA